MKPSQSEIGGRDFSIFLCLFRLEKTEESSNCSIFDGTLSCPGRRIESEGWLDHAAGSGYSRIDIVKATKVLKHAIAKAHIVARLATKQAALLGLQAARFQPRSSFTDLPCRIPRVPDRGGY